MTDGAIRVLIADDHRVVREGLMMFLGEESDDVEVVGQAANGREAVELARSLAPDVVLMDLMMPELDGIEALRALKEAGVESRVVILTTFVDEAKVQEAIRAGATGYLLKDVGRAELLSAVRAAAAGQPTLHPTAQDHLMKRVATGDPPSPLDALTEREREVLALIAAGSSNKEIAAELHLSVGTIKGYVSEILAKLGVSSRTQAALLAVEHQGP